MKTQTLDIFASIWIYWMILSILLAFLGFIFVNNYQKANNSEKIKFLLIGIILIVQAPLSFLLGFQSFERVELQARIELIEILKNPNCRVNFDGIVFDKEKSLLIINELSKVRKTEPHHSNTTKEYRVIIICGQENVLLTLKQDDKIQNEYWIFWDKYRMTKSNELGRIRSDQIKTMANTKYDIIRAKR